MSLLSHFSVRYVSVHGNESVIFVYQFADNSQSGCPVHDKKNAPVYSVIVKLTTASPSNPGIHFQAPLRE